MIQMLSKGLALAMALSTMGQDSVLYFDDSTDVNRPIEHSGVLDADRNGTNDFFVPPSYGICTADIPTSLCTSIYSIGAVGENSLLCNGSRIAVLAAGAIVGPEVPTNSAWRNTEEATLAYFNSSERNGTWGWEGPLATTGSGYIGIRFHAADGIHYGWIYATMRGTTSGNIEGPTYTNWAYESRPNTPILAGALPTALLAQPRIIRANYLRLSWPTELSRAYQIQSKERLDAPWTPLDIIVIGSSTNSSIDVPITTATRFYRIVRVE